MVNFLFICIYLSCVYIVILSSLNKQKNAFILHQKKGFLMIFHWAQNQAMFSIHFYKLTWAEGSSEFFWSKFVRQHRGCRKLFTFSSSSPELLLWWRGINFVQMKGHALFQEEIITKKWKYINKIFKIFFRTTGLISTKLCTKHHLMNSIQFYLNE